MSKPQLDFQKQPINNIDTNSYSGNSVAAKIKYSKSGNIAAEILWVSKPQLDFQKQPINNIDTNSYSGNSVAAKIKYSKSSNNEKFVWWYYVFEV